MHSSVITGTSSFRHISCSLQNIAQYEDHVDHLAAVNSLDSFDENNSQCNCFNAGASGHCQSISPVCKIYSISNVRMNGLVCSSFGQYLHLSCIHIAKLASESLCVWDCRCCLRRSSVAIHPSRVEAQNAYKIRKLRRVPTKLSKSIRIRPLKPFRIE